MKVEGGSESLQNRLGRFYHRDMVGKVFGSQLWSHDNKKHLYLLKPTPELWTRSLPHRTQIVYMHDIAFILLQMDCLPGDKVIESGTGSGSFSHSILRAISSHHSDNNGHLYTFEFHPERAEKAEKEFKEHGFKEMVTIKNRDVCLDGFGLNNVGDSMFLDLPSPWEAIPHALDALRKDKNCRLALFSPCAEQVQRTLPILRKNGFCELEMFEVLIRPLEVNEFLLKPVMIDAYLGNDGDDNDNNDDVVYQGEENIIEGRDSQIRKIDHHHHHILPPSPPPCRSILTTRNRVELKGHTSYLYFATLPKRNL